MIKSNTEKEEEEKEDHDNHEEKEEKKDHQVTSKLKTNDNEKWEGCCSKTSKGFIMFMVQTVVLLSIMLFSLFMLADDKTVQRDLYVSLLSSVMGIYLPSPQLHK